MEQQTKRAPVLMVIIAFITVYIVWGSTYFFIAQALSGFPPFILGASRFIIAGLIMLLWCVITGEKIFDRTLIPKAALGGILMLFFGNGMVIWVEQTLPSAMAAIMISATPLWFVLLDKPMWSTNLRNPATIIALILGFIGVILLFGEKLFGSAITISSRQELVGLGLLNIGVIGWASGSLLIKYKVRKDASAVVNTAWQMTAAGLAFIPGMILLDETDQFQLSQVPPRAWWSLAYLVLMGSIAAFSAYVWLLKVRPVTQVSTYAYVNPLVAVLLGVFIADEKISVVAIVGLGIILLSVLIINVRRQT